MRAGTDTALARVISVFGAAHPHHAYVAKVEWIYQVRYDIRAQARLESVDWIEGFYNRVRAYTQPSDAWPPSKRNAACWRHNLVYMETRQGHSTRPIPNGQKRKTQNIMGQGWARNGPNLGQKQKGPPKWALKTS